MDSGHQEFNPQKKVLNKIIEAKFKSMLKSFTIIREINACCLKSWRPDKKEKFFKPPKKKPKTKLAEDQPILLITAIKPFSQNC